MANPPRLRRYWLNGFVPLAFQLQNAGIDELHPKCTARHDDSDHEGIHEEPGPAVPVGPVKPMAQVETYIAGIMATVGADGWIGPANPSTPVTPGPVPKPTDSCELGQNLYGGDLASPVQLPPGPNATSSACKGLCQANEKCAAYVFHQCGGAQARATCWLKGGGWHKK